MASEDDHDETRRRGCSRWRLRRRRRRRPVALDYFRAEDIFKRRTTDFQEKEASRFLPPGSKSTKTRRRSNSRRPSRPIETKNARRLRRLLSLLLVPPLRVLYSPGRACFRLIEPAPLINAPRNFLTDPPAPPQTRRVISPSRDSERVNVFSCDRRFTGYPLSTNPLARRTRGEWFEESPRCRFLPERPGFEPKPIGREIYSFGISMTAKTGKEKVATGDDFDSER